MDSALKRWTSKDEKSLNEILGIFDVNVSPIQHRRNPNERLKVLGMNQPEFPDDLSTIAGDTLGGTVHTLEAPPKTPEKVKNDETDTQPETPPKSYPSSKTYSYDDEYDRHRICSFCRLFTFAGCLGTILLGAIAIMSITLYQLRNEDTQSNNELNMSGSGSSNSNAAAYDFSDIERNSSTLSPTISNMTADLSEEGQQLLLQIQATILSMTNDFYSESETMSMDPASLHYRVLSWLAEDPLLASYSPSRIVQRYALGVMYLSLTAESKDVTMGGWMTYTDECQWPQSRSSRSMCEPSGNVTAMNLENMGFDGTLPPEIGLLSNLEFLVLKSNSLSGQLPTQLGLLTRLRRLNLPGNAISGTIPTQIGFLENLNLLSLGDNNLAGPLPSQIGNLDRLESLQLQNNALTGNLPEDLWTIESLVTLELEFNQFNGPISTGLGNLNSLEEMTLQGNDLTGTVPQEVCARSSLQITSVDCDKIECSCCEVCDNFFSIPNNDLTPEPAPIEQTVAPTPCQYVRTERSCYSTLDPIDLSTFNCDPSSLDILALYRAQDISESGMTNAIFWIPNCADMECNAAIEEGMLFRENGETDMLATAQWPLPVDEYLFLIFRVSQAGSLKVLAESLPFQVSELC